MIGIEQIGDFKNILNFLNKMNKQEFYNFAIKEYAETGLLALQNATPIDTGETANSWRYEIHRTKDMISIDYYNDNVTQNGTPVAILVQYGHATNHGGFVSGIDYINPALRPVFEDLADAVWKEVERA